MAPNEAEGRGIFSESISAVWKILTEAANKREGIKRNLKKCLKIREDNLNDNLKYWEDKSHENLSQSFSEICE